MPNDDTTSKTPMTISQMPTTSVRIASDAKGDPIITMPANEADQTEEDLPGAAGKMRVADRRDRRCHTAKDEADTNPDGQQQNRVASVPKWRKHNTANTSDGRAADEQQHPPAGGDMKLKAKITCAAPVTSR